MEVMLKDNMRMLDVDEADFTIKQDETKPLSERQLKSYSIKQYLLKGFIKPIAEPISFTFKTAQVVILPNDNYAYFLDNEMYYKKEAGTSTVESIQKDAVPSEALKLLEVQ